MRWPRRKAFPQPFVWSFCGKFLESPLSQNFPLRVTPILKALLLLATLSSLISCGEKKRTKKEERIAADLFFEEKAVAVLSDLENEMADAPTDFLRLFKDDPIPWQAWNKSVPQKALATQRPILALVVSSRDGGCRSTALNLYSNTEILALLKENVCTLIDIHAHPEIGLLSYYLAKEIRQPVGFPMLLWLSHEASPLAWLPAPDLTAKDLRTIISNSSAMVSDIWTESSDYAVKNSRRDSAARQQRLELELKENENETKRQSLFRRQARQTISLYDPISKNIDGSGGLIPVSALELMCKAHLSPLLSPNSRSKAKSAIQGVTSEMQKGAIKDPLDDLYFYARRSPDWSLPAFSKELETQTQIASCLIHCGQAIDDPALIKSGLALLEDLKTLWLANNFTNESSLLEKKIPGIFLWDWITLEKALTPQEFPVATVAFQLEKGGNIPKIADPTSRLHTLNSLRSILPLPQIASALSMSQENVEPLLASATAKLKEHRKQTGAIFRETQVSAQSRARCCLALLDAWSATGSSFHLAEAVVSGNIIRNEHHPEGTQLMRFPASFQLKARGSDYASAALAGVHLYQATLDEEWLSWSLKIALEALDHLAREDDLLISELSDEDRIIPIRIRNHFMIYNESTLGVFDQAISRLAALTENKRLKETRIAINKSLARHSERLPITHTDFISSCALASAPIVAVLSGDFRSPGYQKLVRQLNHPEFLSFLTIRSDQDGASLAPLPEIKTFAGSPRVTLVRDGLSIGQAQNIADLRVLLNKELSRKE